MYSKVAKLVCFGRGGDSVEYGMQSPTLKSGYAYSSSRRVPRAPEIVIVADSDTAGAKHCGTVTIDGACCNAFRCRIGRRYRYYFQTALFG